MWVNQLKEENYEIIVKEIFETSNNHSCKIIFPEDVLVGKNLNDTSKTKRVK